MKLVIIISAFLVLFSCTPESMVNSKIDGTWELITIGGQTLNPGYSKKVVFEKDRKGGKITYTETNNGVTNIKNGEYALIKSGAISIAFPNTNYGSGYETETYDFTSCTKEELILTETGKGSQIYTFKKL